MVRKLWLVSLLSVLMALAIICLLRYWFSAPNDRLPFHDRFAARHAEEWQAYGGTWSFKDHGVINRSDERGAKLIAGNEQWSDYQIHADIQMLGWGDMGLLTRVSHASVGINSYRGYYAGIQSRDGALILGAANDDWIAVKPTAIEGGIHSGLWYHLDLVVVGCTIGAHLKNLQNGAEAWSALRQVPCLAKGKIGLRSLDTGATWKNITVEKATESDLDLMLQHVPQLQAPTYPSREEDLAQMMLSYYGDYAALERSILRREIFASSEDERSTPSLESIKSLKVASQGETVRVRGVVTLYEPLYILDATGGVSIQLQKPMPLNVGDEVEVTGAVQSRSGATFQANHVRVLWDRTPMQPMSITSAQAASGAYEGSLIELRGDLISNLVSEDGNYILDMQDSSQRFRVIVPQGLNTKLPAEWKVGSLLKVRGVCTNPSANQQGDVSFLIRSRSDADIETLSGPPWNSGPRLYFLIGISMLLLVLVTAIYLQAERWRVQVVSQERERLAMEMHDTLAQSFAGVSFHLQSMRKSMQGQVSVPEKLMEKLDVACSMTAETHRETSDRLVSLHPASGTEDLLAQLRRSTISMLNGSHLRIRTSTTGEKKKFSIAARHELMGISREGIANVLRHSNASEIRFSLQYAERYAVLTIRDNGNGFDVDKDEGFGIKGMRQRAESIGAQLEIDSALKEGTTVLIRTPYGRRVSIFDWPRFLRRRLLSKQG
jgi:signal transduction histidine kinase